MAKNVIFWRKKGKKCGIFMKRPKNVIFLKKGKKNVKKNNFNFKTFYSGPYISGRKQLSYQLAA